MTGISFFFKKNSKEFEEVVLTAEATSAASLLAVVAVGVILSSVSDSDSIEKSSPELSYS